MVESAVTVFRGPEGRLSQLVMPVEAVAVRRIFAGGGEVLPEGGSTAIVDAALRSEEDTGGRGPEMAICALLSV